MNDAETVNHCRRRGSEMSRAPKAFMSYVNLDDQHNNGLITQFREQLSRAVRMQTGEAFDIFQDRKDIVWGQQWQKRINESLDATTFLIPIITPAFFKSDICRDELERFLKREEELQRGDLILPVYYVSCPVLSDNAKREHADWRELRFEDFTSSQCRRAFAKLAEQIAAALERSEAESARAEAERKADAAKGTPPQEPSNKESEGTASQSNMFQSKGEEQNIAQGSNSIGTQNNYYGPQRPEMVVTRSKDKVSDQQNNDGRRKNNAASIKIIVALFFVLVFFMLFRSGLVFA